MAIKVGDYVIYSSVDNIVSVLREELLMDYGVVRFERGKTTNGNYMTNCPFHSEGREKKPSFGISENGECHCFSCGYSTKDFGVFINNLFDRPDNDSFAQSWVSRHLDTIEQTPRFIQMDFGRNRKSAIETNEIPESILDTYRYTHPYMYKRGLTDEIIEKFDVGYDQKNHCITFPVKELDGRVSAVVTRSVISKFFSIPSGYQKPVYGGYLFTSGKYNYAYVCESIFNALTCWVYNKPAVALIGTGTIHQLEILRKLPVREYILALDPDDAGEKGMSRLRNGLKGYKLLSQVIYNKDDHRDINDLQAEFFTLPTKIV